MTEESRRWDGYRVNVANVMDKKCYQSTEYGRGRGYEAPKVIDVGEAKCGNEGITTFGALLDDDGYSDKISSIICVKSAIIS